MEELRGAEAEVAERLLKRLARAWSRSGPGLVSEVGLVGLSEERDK